ncbi:hypothetical protein LCGC14_3051130 [marine sediment metagenome]|uniref:Uncharacterized protein n=1 Tax=marine sediment metagenome TaxID=412755 RepID=A0A0F8ZCJ7_9ZZZZ
MLNITEPNINIQLANLIETYGIRALGEISRISHQERTIPDVLLDINGILINLEGKKVCAAFLLLIRNRFESFKYFIYPKI